MNHSAKLQPGEARCPDAPTIQELVRAGGGPVPFALDDNRYEFLGDEPLTHDRYASQAYYDREMEKLWPNVWQWACREEQIAEAGDYIVYDIGKYSFLIVRTEDMDVRAFYNSCTHRGTKLRPSGTDGSTAEFRCPFHGWSWNVDGSLKGLPCHWDFPHVSNETHRLDEVRVAQWGGFVFINMNKDAPSLEDYMAPLGLHAENWDFSKRYIALHIEKELSANWKACTEAFLEGYHLLETHPQLTYSTPDANAQYDNFGDHVTRSWVAIGAQSPHHKERLTEQQILDLMFTSDKDILSEPPVLQDGETARTAMTRILRESLAKNYQIDLANYCDSEIVDVIQYHLFPNMVLHTTFTNPLFYRFRPLDDSRDKCLFEIFILQPVPDHGERPAPAQPYRITESESFTTVPGMPYDMGFIFDQDTDNLRWIQEGVKTSPRAGATLGNYQEIRIRQLEQTVDKYLTGTLP